MVVSAFLLILFVLFFVFGIGIGSVINENLQKSTVSPLGSNNYRIENAAYINTRTVSVYGEQPYYRLRRRPPSILTEQLLQKQLSTPPLDLRLYLDQHDSAETDPVTAAATYRL